MQSIYTSYECRTCRKEFILLTEDVDQVSKGRYVACTYCSSKRVDKAKSTDDLRECMQERSYKRVKGALRQK
jgi:DNA-directed RNA polymerase subunit RPC12/RpoP